LVNTKNRDKELIKMRLIPKNEFDENGRILGKKADMNAVFGICTIPNIRLPKLRTI
jgi:hypothetical protein